MLACHILCAQGYDKKALSEQVFGNLSCDVGKFGKASTEQVSETSSCDGSQFGKLPCELDRAETVGQKQRKYCSDYGADCNRAETSQSNFSHSEF